MAMPFTPCDADPCTDKSVEILTGIFGKVIKTLTEGGDPDTIDAAGNMLASMFAYFNSGILVIGSLIVSYVAIMGTVNTANDGEAMGKNWSSFFTPVRIVSGGAVLLPSTSGYSFIQLIVLMFALWGVGFANGIYKIGMATGLLNPNAVVNSVNNPDAFSGLREFGQQYLAVAYCAKVANTIYAEGGSAPQPLVGPPVPPAPTPDLKIKSNGRIDNIYYFKDRNPITNLAGGEPFCGTVKIAEYDVDASKTDPGEVAMEQVRKSIQATKINAANYVMEKLDEWVQKDWPASSNPTQSELSNIASDKFNIIIAQGESLVVTGISNNINGQKATVDTGLKLFLDKLTDGGWANASGWFQRVGMLRGQMMDVISAPIGEIAKPSLIGLPEDSRYAAVELYVNNVVNTVKKNAETKPGYDASDTDKPESVATFMPTDAKASFDFGAIKSNMDAKMSTFASRQMKKLTEIATGANGDGTVSTFCGTAGEIGGSINRMKCVGDYMSIVQKQWIVVRATILTTVAGVRALAGGFSVSILGNKAPFDVVAAAGWEWLIQVPIWLIEKIIEPLESLARYFSVIIPSMPYGIFMVVVVGWVLGVLQAVIAAPLWAVMHMTPDRTFIGSQTQGYLLLLSLFARPALALIGLFAAVLVSDPIINFIVTGFFSMQGALNSSTGAAGMLAEWLNFMWWFQALAIILLPVLYMIFALPQTLPGQVLTWIGGGIKDLGEGGASSAFQQNMARVGASGAASKSITGGNQGRKQLAAKEPGGNTPGAGGGRDLPSSNTSAAPMTSPQGVAPNTPDYAPSSASGSGRPVTPKSYGTLSGTALAVGAATVVGGALGGAARAALGFGKDMISGEGVISSIKSRGAEFGSTMKQAVIAGGNNAYSTDHGSGWQAQGVAPDTPDYVPSGASASGSQPVIASAQPVTSGDVGEGSGFVDTSSDPRYASGEAFASGYSDYYGSKQSTPGGETTLA